MRSSAVFDFPLWVCRFRTTPGRAFGQRGRIERRLAGRGPRGGHAGPGRSAQETFVHVARPGNARPGRARGGIRPASEVLPRRASRRARRHRRGRRKLGPGLPGRGPGRTKAVWPRGAPATAGAGPVRGFSPGLFGSSATPFPPTGRAVLGCARRASPAGRWLVTMVRKDTVRSSQIWRDAARTNCGRRMTRMSQPTRTIIRINVLDTSDRKFTWPSWHRPGSCPS
jgi:hypothetical protein